MFTGNWITKSQPDDDINEIVNISGVKKLTAKLLYNRGITKFEDIKVFLKEKYFVPADPFLIHDMDRAVSRLHSAIENKQKIVIYGDYDVDGVTSVSVMCKFLKEKGLDADFYIPNRADDGYGLSIAALDNIIASGADLLITVDCGITAIKEIEYATQKGLDVIITDHHQCKDEIPDCCAIINPKYHKSTYPYRELAGVGVAFKLICAYEGSEKYYDCLEKYSDIVAIGTVADIMPLTGENRIIAKHGLKRIAAGDTVVGVTELLKVCGLENRPVTATTISYSIAPKINAAGRLGSCDMAVQLFLTDNAETAAKIANQLLDKNIMRQQTENEIFTDAIEQVESNPDIAQSPVLVLSSENWHSGVIGIVASRLSEKYARPCILISTADGTGKGSGRSISGFNIFKALSACADLLEKFGGHDLAAGITVSPDKIDEFRDAINSYATFCKDAEENTPKFTADCSVKCSELDIKTVRQISLLEPFGCGNEQPILKVNNLSVTGVAPLSNGKHARFYLEGGGMRFSSVCFGLKYDDALEFAHSKINVLCCPEIYKYMDNERVQLIIKSIKKAV